MYVRNVRNVKKMLLRFPRTSHEQQDITFLRMLLFECYMNVEKTLV